jgi:hypothetical protein
MLICDAIRARKLMMYAYGGLIRVVEPHLLGETNSGDPLLSGWLRPGYSRSDPNGGWRTWRVDRISSAQILDEQFPSPRPGYNPRDPRMVRVACALSAAALTPDAEPAPHAPDDAEPDAIEPVPGSGAVPG